VVVLLGVLLVLLGVLLVLLLVVIDIGDKLEGRRV